MARKKAGEQTNPQAAVAQSAKPPQTAGSVKETQVPKEASQHAKAKANTTGAQNTSAPAPAAAEAPEPRLVLRISAKLRNGFRRCGVHHPAAAVDHPEGRFSAAEIERLKAEPNLVVEDL